MLLAPEVIEAMRPEKLPSLDEILSKRIGQYNRKNMQRQCITWILVTLGDDAYEAIGRNVNLKKVLKEAKHYFCPRTMHLDTIRRWFHHFLQHGETPEETAEWKRGQRRKKIKRTRLPRRTSSWTDRDLEKLKQIVDQNLELYLDEIQLAMMALTGRKFKVVYLVAVAQTDQ